MYCPNCGTRNEDYANVCVRCGHKLIKPEGEPVPPPAGEKPVESEPAQRPEYEPDAQPTRDVAPPPGYRQEQPPYQAPPQYQAPPPFQDPRYQYGAPPNIPNYLVQSILVTIFCCLIGGIIAIIYSAQVNTKIAQGDYEGAQSSARTALTFCWISFGLGLFGNVAYFVLMIIGIMAEGGI